MTGVAFVHVGVMAIQADARRHFGRRLVGMDLVARRARESLCRVVVVDGQVVRVDGQSVLVGEDHARRGGGHEVFLVVTADARRFRHLGLFQRLLLLLRIQGHLFVRLFKSGLVVVARQALALQVDMLRGHAGRVVERLHVPFVAGAAVAVGGPRESDVLRLRCISAAFLRRLRVLWSARGPEQRKAADEEGRGPAPESFRAEGFRS